MNLHFEAVGEGRPLIILHGLLGSADNWRSMSRRLGAHYKVFAVGKEVWCQAFVLTCFARPLKKFVDSDFRYATAQGGKAQWGLA